MGKKDTAKLVSHVQRRKEVAKSSGSGSKFNKSQSQYARREEEKQIKENYDDPSRSRFEAAKTRSAQPVTGTLMKHTHISSRQARANTFALNQSGVGTHGHEFTRDITEQSGGILGLVHHRSKEEEESDKLPEKQSKHEKFEELISDTRRSRAHDRKEREERQQATNALDAEFNEVAHLLTKRDKRKEEFEAFQASGTDEVRALLAAHKARNEGKSRSLVIGGDGNNAAATATGSGGSAKKQAAATDITKKNPMLDAESAALLAKINKKEPQIKRDTFTQPATTTAGEKKSSAAAAAAALPEKKKNANETVVAADEEEEEEYEGDGSSDEEKENDGEEDATYNGTEYTAVNKFAEMDFDRMMGTMRLEQNKAHAVDRTLDEKEIAEEEAKQERIRHMKSIGEVVSTEDQGITRKEWIEQGGERVHRMDGERLEDLEDDDESIDYDGIEDDEEGGESRAEKKAAAVKKQREQQAHPLDLLFIKLEKIVKNDQTSSSSRAQQLDELLPEMHEICKNNPRHAVETFRLYLSEGYRLLSKGLPQTPTTIAVYLLAIKIFPLTDYRHPVVTPLIILLASLCAQAKLDTLENVEQGLVLCSMLVHILCSNGKYCGEPLVLLLNIISLVVPQSTLQPHAHEMTTCQFPLMSRTKEALLGSQNVSKTAKTDNGKLSVFPSKEEKSGKQSKTSAKPLILLSSAYALLMTFVDSFSNIPGVSACVEPFVKLCASIDSAVPSKVKDVHLACLEHLQSVDTNIHKFRTPLAMRTFRPAPLRQHEPLLVEIMDEDKRELQHLKKDMKEERKRVVRSVQAEAAVERQAREKEQEADSRRREDKLKKIMGEIEQQQHIMKTVDNLKDKAKNKKRKGVDGAAGKGGDDDNVPTY